MTNSRVMMIRFMWGSPIIGCVTPSPFDFAQGRLRRGVSALETTETCPERFAAQVSRTRLPDLADRTTTASPSRRGDLRSGLVRGRETHAQQASRPVAERCF